MKTFHQDLFIFPYMTLILNILLQTLPRPASSVPTTLFFPISTLGSLPLAIKACFKGKSPLTALRCSVALKQTQTDNKRVYITQESQTDRRSDLTGSGNKE